MISLKRFNTKFAECYCQEIEKIENYEEALNDKDNLWIPHHKLEAFFTKDELIEMGRYWNIPARELVFVKRSEHYKKWPHIGVKIMGEKVSAALKGKLPKNFYERCAAGGRANKGRIPWNKGLRS